MPDDGTRAPGPAQPPCMTVEQRALVHGQLLGSDIVGAEHCLNVLFPFIRISLSVSEEVSPYELRLVFEPGRVDIRLSARCADPHVIGITGRAVEMVPAIAFIAASVSGSGPVTMMLTDAGSSHALSFCGIGSTAGLIPDCEFVVSEGYARERRSFAEPPPFLARRNLAFWRGTTTGERIAGWRSLPRIRLCQFAMLPENAELLDCKISRVVQAESETELNEIAEAGLMGEHVPASSFADYRFQIDMDGNTNSWPGLFIKLLSGSPVLKVDSPRDYRQWYYDRLQPWYNFIPVATDLSDLMPKLRWLTANPAFSEKIGQRGRELALAMTYGSELERAAATVDTLLRARAGR